MESKAVNLTARILQALMARARLLRGAMIALMVIVVAIDFIKPKAYSRFPWDSIPAFTAAYAFIGALVLIGLYKAVGYGLVYRSADYYDSKAKQDEQEGQ